MAIARGPHISLHHISFEMRGMDEYMRGTGRVIRSGARKVWGPGRHLAGDNTFTLLPRPARQHGRVHDRAGAAGRGHLAPARLRLLRPEVTDQWGTANPMNELVAKESFNDVDRGFFVAPPV